MARSRALALLSLGALAVLCVPFLTGCGDEDAPPVVVEERAWSDHAGGDAGPVGHGSPDGAAPAVRTPEALLAALHTRIVEQRGMADAGYEKDVRDVAAVLWPPDGDADQMAAAEAHMRVVAIAAQVSGWLGEGKDARTALAKTHPIDLKIHDAFLGAAKGTPDAYSLWCGSKGVALLQELEAARRAKFFPPR